MKKTFFYCVFLILNVAVGAFAMINSAFAASTENSQLKWQLSSFPNVAVSQKNYPDINLDDYLATDSTGQEHFTFSLTPGKPNPGWVDLRGRLLHIITDQISTDDVDTTQVIYLTATNPHNGEASDAEMTIQISANDQLPAPEWQTHFTLNDAIPGAAYSVNLAGAINTSNLPNKDQLIFQLVKSEADWLAIGENGFSLTAKKIPEPAAGKNINVILRVTSKMSGKSSDFHTSLFVNPLPQPLEWQSPPSATINQNYSLDLTKYISSHIRNDHFSFNVDTATLPHWLNVQNNQILTGLPQQAWLVTQPQTVTITAKSLVSGMISKTTLTIPVNPDQHLAPQWKKAFLTHPIVAGAAYYSDNLTTALENRYAHDELEFSYLDGPEWLGLNSSCHCLASKDTVPDTAGGQTFTIHLRVYSKASGQAADYQQAVTVYTGVPHWVKTTLPAVQIAENGNISVPLSDYTQDDINGDQFIYQLDSFHSPSWVSLNKQGEQFYLVMHPSAITAEEVDTVQTARIIAASQITGKTSVQLLTINVKTNPALPNLVWKNTSLSVATVGFQHVVDLMQSIQNILPDDHLTITLDKSSPTWLSIQNNRLIGIPPRDQIGGPYPVNLIVHSQAAGADTLIQTQISVQLAVVAGDSMEIHSFYDNHQSIVIRGLQKNHRYRLLKVTGSHFDYGPFYSPYPIKTAEDWNNNPFYSVGSDQTIKTGDDGIVSIVYYAQPTSPAPHFESVILG